MAPELDPAVGSSPRWSPRRSFFNSSTSRRNLSNRMRRTKRNNGANRLPISSRTSGLVTACVAWHIPNAVSAQSLAIVQLQPFIKLLDDARRLQSEVGQDDILPWFRRVLQIAQHLALQSWSISEDLKYRNSILTAVWTTILRTLAESKSRMSGESEKMIKGTYKLQRRQSRHCLPSPARSGRVLRRESWIEWI